jgi:GR25 family glycosyltransferase involved in LPS biosynthesis
MNYEIKVLSLKRIQDRRNYITKLFDKKYNFSFFDAIDGKETYVPEHLFSNSDYHLWNVDANCVRAVAISNMLIWEESFKENKNICVFEDDIDFNNDQILDIGVLFEMDFDIFFLNNIKEWYPNCFCYLIKPDGAKKLYDYFNNNGFKRSLDWELVTLPDSFNIQHTHENNFTKLNDDLISKSDIIKTGNLYKTI